MFESQQHLRRHWERIYNAKPSPEIAKTRKQPHYLKRPKHKRPQSCDQGQLSRGKSASNFELFPTCNQRQSSAYGLEEDIGKKGSRMKYNSVRSSMNDLHSVTTNMSDKIDRFLDVVEKCENDLKEEFEVRRRRLEERRRPVWCRSMSTVSNRTLNSRVDSLVSSNNARNKKDPENKKKVSNAKSDITIHNKERIRAAMSAQAQRVRSKTSGLKPLKAFKIKDFPVIDTDQIQSKLKNDKRNYQPPRRIKRIPNPKPDSADEVNDYEDDFDDDIEADEGGDEEEEEEEEEEMMMTRQWISDQAARGLARQRALQMHKRKFETHDRDSSNADSAYGYSGGESRLATREPTPDTYNQWHGHQQRVKKLSSASKPSQERKISLRRHRSSPKISQSTSKDLCSDEENTSAHVEFVNKVTREILQKGIYTDRGIRETLEQFARGQDGISRVEVSQILTRLRREFGVQSHNLSASLSEGNFRKFSSKGQQLLTGKKTDPASEQRCDENSLGRGKKLAEPYCDEDLIHLLKEDADIDSETVLEIMKALKGKEKLSVLEPPDQQDQLRLFDSLNISNLNISFNAQTCGKNPGKDKSLLIKSFARNNPDKSSRAKRQGSSSSNPDNIVVIPVPKQRFRGEQAQGRNPAGSEKKEAVEQLPESPLHSSETPRSSSLYQPESEDKFQYDSDDISIEEDDAAVKHEQIYTDDISEDDDGPDISEHIVED